MFLKVVYTIQIEIPSHDPKLLLNCQVQMLVVIAT